MTNHVGRLYGLAATLLVFFVAWAVVAAHPWTTAATSRDPRLVALAKREQQLRREARLVQKVVDRRFSDYRRQLAAYKAALAKRRAAQAATISASTGGGGGASSGVRIVTLPPLVITRTS